jgi:hypothetical protein
MTSAITSPINLGLALSADSAPKEIRGFIESIHNALKQLQLALNTYAGASMQLTEDWGTVTPDQTVIVGNMGRLYVPAIETISFGHVINLFDNAGVLSVRKANATNNTKPCHGWCSHPGGIAIGTFGETQIGPSLNTGVTTLVRGTRYALSTTDGLITAAAPVAAGNIEQWISFALSPTLLFMNPVPFWVQH